MPKQKIVLKVTRRVELEIETVAPFDQVEAEELGYGLCHTETQDAIDSLVDMDREGDIVNFDCDTAQVRVVQLGDDVIHDEKAEVDQVDISELLSDVLSDELDLSENQVRDGGAEVEQTRYYLAAKLWLQVHDSITFEGETYTHIDTLAEAVKASWVDED
jgi:hypothetical protein